MITFNSQYIENQVRERFERTFFSELTPPSKTEALNKEDLQKIECISIGCSDSFWGIRSSAMHKFWHTEMSTHWCGYTWCSLDLDFNELIKTDGWEDDLKQFSHIHTFYCTEQVSIDLISNFKKLANFGLSGMDISDWSFLTGFQNLYTVSLNRCGSDGNQAVKFLCNLYGTQKHHPARNDTVQFIGVTCMSVDDLTPFVRIGDSLHLCELNLSNNNISDISPLSGASVDTMILNNNDIEDITQFERSKIYWLDLDNNRLKPEDIRKTEDDNNIYL